MQPDLQAFLMESFALPFRWGLRDCGLWTCDWIVRRRGIDPAADIRGSYATARGCRRMLDRAGGLMALMSTLFARAALAPVEAAALGAGDVICADAAMGLTMGIAVGHGRCAFIRDHGLIATAAFQVRRAWRV